jgi:hypothetical protein
MLGTTSFPRVLRDTSVKMNREEVFEGLFDKTKDTDKYRDDAKRASFGESIRGSGGQILENLAYPLSSTAFPNVYSR